MKKDSFIVLICIIAILIAVPALMAAENQAARTGKAERIEPKQLEGRWLRPDGGYILELRDIKKDGSLKAAYFNPRPINVAMASLQNKDGRISLSVELRDVNYPGSLYELQYDPKTDRLIGTYFQAVERQTFTIEFVRVKGQ
ncbi:MAG: hypothetical protein H6Q52_3270 [Deltaproteobacteria bacterium]|nr:hypothetical protein [Deltaproteobacteria bacterium]